MLHPLITVIAICFMGSAALIPVMYLGINGDDSLVFIVITAIFGTSITDIFWMWLARRLGQKKIEQIWIIKNNLDHFRKIESSVKKHGVKMLFFSKFIQGAGIASQVAAGVFKIPWIRAISANFLGAVSWTTIVYFLAKRASSLSILEENITAIKFGFLLIFIAFLLFNIFYYFKNRNPEGHRDI